MKLLVVALIVVGLVVGRRVYVQWLARQQRGPSTPTPRVPSELLGDADRTWVVFTTPFCASCGPVKESLAVHDPQAEIVTVDATREPRLADTFAVRSAPTVLLADRVGDVQARLVGAPAVRDYLSARTA